MFTPQRGSGAVWQATSRIPKLSKSCYPNIKMNKKRRSEDSAESNTPAKKVKAPEFNGTAFKAMLKDPGTAMKGNIVRSLSRLLNSMTEYATKVDKMYGLALKF